jgi:hypothetical protein
LVQTNAPLLTTASSNLVHFSEQLDQVTEELQLTIATNRVEITAAVQNVEKGTVLLNRLLGDLQEGKGLAGSVLKDQGLQDHFATILGNLSTVSSNLANHGLLWRPRTTRLNTNTAIYPGKNPFD